MSTTAQLVHEASVLAAENDGLIDLLSAKVEEVRGLLRLFGAVAGMGFVIWQALASRGALARIIVSGLAAGCFVWIVWNVTELEDRVDNEVNSAPAVQDPSRGVSTWALPAHLDASGTRVGSAAAPPAA